MINSKFSLAHLSMIEETIFNLIKIAEMTGYEYVSPRLKVVTQEEESHKLVGDAHAIAECQKILADSKVKVLDIELLAIRDDTDVRAEFEPVLETGALIGAQFAIAQVHSASVAGGLNTGLGADVAPASTADRVGGLNTGLGADASTGAASGLGANMAPNMMASVEKFRQLCDLAATYNIKVVLEMLPWSSIPDVRTVNDFILSANSDNSGILLDLLHLYRSKTDPKEINIIDQKYLHYAHLCDAKGKGIKSFTGQKFIAREARYPAGRGDIAILEYLDNINCDVFSLEIPNERLHRHLGSIEYARYILQDTKNYLILEECWRVKSKYKSVPDRLI